jgi:ABC-2 type transport system permease protein
MNDGSVHFNISDNGVNSEAAVNFSNEKPLIDIRPNNPKDNVENINIVSSILKDSDAFNAMVLGVMYANCGMLYLIFSIVLGAYALRSLFDDRKNKDILFWRSMPVSETTNVLIKLGMLLLVAPLIMLALNLLTIVLTFVLGLIFFVAKGVAFSHLMSSVLTGGAFIIPFQIFYELVFSLLMSMPIIGFAFLASAFAKKTPFFTFASPAILILADKILGSKFGINIGVIDLLSIYAKALVNVQDAFLLQHVFVFTSSMIFPLLACLVTGALFIAGAIWLRNNRYEI